MADLRKLSKRNTEQVIDETPAFPLPPELIGEIVGNLLDDHATLCSLSLANKLLQNECQPLLYRVVVHNPLNGRGAPVTTFKKFPYLTRHIHAYHIGQLGTYAPRKDSWDLLRPGPALSAMRNLKSLHIRVIHRNIVQDILTDCPFQLVSFSWILPLETGRLLQFLATQGSIRCLSSRISMDTFSGPLAVPVCENLEQLEGDRGSIETFLPGRRITSLVWIPSWGDSTSGVEHLANEFGAIQNLTFHTSFGRKHVVGFNTIVPYLKNLQCLELSTFVSPDFHAMATNLFIIFSSLSTLWTMCMSFLT